MEPFTKSKTMVFPRDVRVGHGALDELGSVLHDLGVGEHALVVTGSTTRKLAGERALEVVRKAGYGAALLQVASATLDQVAAVEGEARKQRPAGVLGVGGGSVIDVAKLAAFRIGAPFVSVPTSASHDGITSPRASIKEDTGSSSKRATTPVAIVADTEIIVKAPFRSLTAGCADAISNGTAVLDWKLAHRLRGEEYSSFAANLAESAAEMILQNAAAIKPNLEESAWLVVKSLIVSGVSMSVAGSSRPASGAEHMFSHALDELVSPNSLDHRGGSGNLARPPGPRAYHGEQVGVGS